MTKKAKKEKLLVSFSGGETSGFMCDWLIRNKSQEYEMVFVFANTGEENEETLNFVNKCDKKFNLNLVWVEADVQHGERLGTKHKIVNYKTASRKGEPFEEMIRKYGIPNQAYPHCNRELKLAPIHNYVKSVLKWEDYKTAIGIRYDEVDRVAANRKVYNLIYPLIENVKMTKPKINFWWSQQDFRLNLKSYQGNCKACWKKSNKNLYKIAQENPEYFDFFRDMEIKYSRFVKEGRSKQEDKKDFYFFRNNKSVKDIFKMSKKFKGEVKDSSIDKNYQTDLFEEESCDIFSNCGDV